MEGGRGKMEMLISSFYIVGSEEIVSKVDGITIGHESKLFRIMKIASWNNVKQSYSYQQNWGEGEERKILVLVNKIVIGRSQWIPLKLRMKK